MITMKITDRNNKEVETLTFPTKKAAHTYKMTARKNRLHNHNWFTLTDREGVVYDNSRF